MPLGPSGAHLRFAGVRGISLRLSGLIRSIEPTRDADGSEGMQQTAIVLPQPYGGGLRPG
jgi:hypothetical protein